MTINLSMAKQNVLDALPQQQSGAVSYSSLSEQLGRTESTVRNHIRELVDRGVNIQYETVAGKKQFWLVGGVEHPTNANPDYQEETRKKQTKTNSITKHMTRMQRRLYNLLDESEPAVADGGHPVTGGREDLVIHRTDPHFGDKLTDEFGNVVYDPDIAERRERCITDRAMEQVQRQEAAGYEFDTANLLLGGDLVTGENTYQKQQTEIIDYLDEQVDRASEVFIDQIMRLSGVFPAVRVVCQPGNHGALEGGYSDGANTDRLLYMMLDKMVRMSDMENVTFVRNDAARFTNFYVRTDKHTYENNVDPDGYKFHLRHGDDSLEHIGTSAGKRRWYNWMLRHEFDQGYRGHYHQFEIDTVHGDTKVIMTGSPKPPDISDRERNSARWFTEDAADLAGAVVNTGGQSRWWGSIEVGSQSRWPERWQIASVASVGDRIE